MRTALAMAATFLALVGVGCGSDSPENATTSTEATAPVLRKCPSAASWGASVSGIRCEDAGKLIARHLNSAFGRNVLDGARGPYTPVGIAQSKPGEFDAYGYSCHHAAFDPSTGWAIRCQNGDQIVAFTLTP